MSMEYQRVRQVGLKNSLLFFQCLTNMRLVAKYTKKTQFNTKHTKTRVSNEIQNKTQKTFFTEFDFFLFFCNKIKIKHIKI